MREDDDGRPSIEEDHVLEDVHLVLDLSLHGYQLGEHQGGCQDIEMNGSLAQVRLVLWYPRQHLVYAPVL